MRIFQTASTVQFPKSPTTLLRKDAHFWSRKWWWTSMRSLVKSWQNQSGLNRQGHLAGDQLTPLSPRWQTTRKTLHRCARSTCLGNKPAIIAVSNCNNGEGQIINFPFCSLIKELERRVTVRYVAAIIQPANGKIKFSASGYENDTERREVSDQLLIEADYLGRKGV